MKSVATPWLTQKLLHTLFEYKEGLLYWKVALSKKIRVGQEAGPGSKSVYKKIRINGKYFLTHRLVFLMHHGHMPDYIDHIDRNKRNNRVENLRPASISENNLNSKVYSNNVSGVKGICWHKSHQKWYGQVSLNKKRYVIGLFTDLKKAKKAIEQFRKEHQGSFFNEQ